MSTTKSLPETNYFRRLLRSEAYTAPGSPHALARALGYGVRECEACSRCGGLGTIYDFMRPAGCPVCKGWGSGRRAG